MQRIVKTRAGEIRFDPASLTDKTDLAKAREAGRRLKATLASLKAAPASPAPKRKP